MVFSTLYIADVPQAPSQQARSPLSNAATPRLRAHIHVHARARSSARSSTRSSTRSGRVHLVSACPSLFAAFTF